MFVGQSQFGRHVNGKLRVTDFVKGNWPFQYNLQKELI